MTTGAIVSRRWPTAHRMLVPYLRVCSAKPRQRPPPDIWPRITSDGDLEGLLALDLWPRYRAGTPTGSSVSPSLQALVPLLLCCSAEREAGSETELLEHVPQLGVHGVGRDEELLGDLSVGPALRC